VPTASPTSSGKEKAVKKLIKTVWRREDGKVVSPDSEKMSELVPMKLKKKAGKCTVMEPEAVSKTNTALLKAVVKHNCGNINWKKENIQSVRELSTVVNISMRRTQKIILNYLSHKIVEDIVNGRQTSSLRLADLRDIQKLWSEQLEKFYA
jgi:hypothetical protein